MEHRLDSLAKTLSSGKFTRRQALWRFGMGLGAALLTLGATRVAATNDCAKFCVDCCVKNLGLRGRELGECIRLCHDGEGICGPIVCPGGMHPDDQDGV